MRKCCCCISVHHGSILMGLLEIVLASLSLLLIVPYLLEMDDNNPIEKYSETVFYHTEEFLRGQNITKEHVDETMSTCRKYFYPAILSAGIVACGWIVILLCMIFGVLCEKRALLLPYLIIQLMKIVAFVMLGFVATLTLFYKSILLGAMALGSYGVSSFIAIYLWNVVRSSYKKLGYESTYNTSPVKPIYNPRDDGYFGQEEPLMMQ